MRRGFAAMPLSSLYERKRQMATKAIKVQVDERLASEIAQKRNVRWTWICQSSELGELVKRAFRRGLSRRYLTGIAPPPYDRGKVFCV